MSDSKTTVYALINGNNIIDELLGYPTEFKNVRMYGTREDPLFYAKDVGKILKIQNIRDTISSFDGRFVKRKCEVEFSETRRGKAIKIIRKVNMLTEIGLYRIIGSSRSKVTENFWIFIGIVLKKLRLDGEVRLKDAQKELKKKLIASGLKNADQEAVIINQQIQLNELKEYKIMLGDDSFEYEGDDNEKLAMLFKKTMFKKYYIYLVKSEYVDKKKVAKPKTKSQIQEIWEEEYNVESLPEGHAGGYLDEFGYLNPEDVDENDGFYYYMTDAILDPAKRTNYNMMETVYFPNSTEFKKFKETLKKQEHGKSIFLIARSTLKNFIFTFNCNYLRQKMNEIENKERAKVQDKLKKFSDEFRLNMEDI